MLRQQGGQFVQPDINLADPVALKRRGQLIRRLVRAGRVGQSAAQAVGLAIAGVCCGEGDEQVHVQLAEGRPVFLAAGRRPLFPGDRGLELAARLGGEIQRDGGWCAHLGRHLADHEVHLVQSQPLPVVGRQLAQARKACQVVGARRPLRYLELAEEFLDTPAEPETSARNWVRP
jgi:hypothetical protein